MTQEQLQWLLLVVSGAPIQTLKEAQFKQEWLAEIIRRIEDGQRDVQG